MMIREALEILKREDPDLYAQIKANGKSTSDIQILMYADQLRKKKQENQEAKK